MDIIQILITIVLITLSLWLFLKAQPKNTRILLDYSESKDKWSTTKDSTAFNAKEFFSIVKVPITILIGFLIIIITIVGYFFGPTGVLYLFLFFLTFIVLLILFIFFLARRESRSFGETLEFIKYFTTLTFSATMRIENAYYRAPPIIDGGIRTEKWIENLLLSGYVELPYKIYVNESASIIINLSSKVVSSEKGREFMKTSQKDTLFLVDIHLQRRESVTSCLKVELQAASLSQIAGETTQQVDLRNDNLKFQWSVSSDKPTLHNITLIFSKISGSMVKNLGDINHSIKVVNLFGLTRRQVLISGMITGLLAFVPGIVKLLEVFGYLNKN